MQQVRVDELDSQMLERAGERLLDLNGNGGPRVIGQTMILAALECELGLQKELIPRNQPAPHRRTDALADRSFIVMTPLIGRINAAKSLFQCQLRQTLRGILFPRGSVEEAGNLWIIDRW